MKYIVPGLLLAFTPWLALAQIPAYAEIDHPGEPHYRRICIACHDPASAFPGAMGAPRVGHSVAWESRIPRGINGLFLNITSPPPGREPMPRADLTDNEVRAAIAYMIWASDPLTMYRNKR